MGNRYQISKNIFYNFLGQGILLILGFIATPIIIYALGKDYFGIYVLLLTVVGYFSILDFGLGLAVTKAVSESAAKRDQHAIQNIFSTALLIFSIIGILGMILIMLATKFMINNLLNIPTQIKDVATLSFYVGSISFLTSMLSMVFVSVFAGLQRMDIINSRNVILGFLITSGTVLLSIFGFSLIEIIIWNVTISFLAITIFLVIMRKVLPTVEVRFGFDKNSFFQLFKFGGFKFLSNVSGQIIFYLDRFLIGIFQPISSLAFYNPPASLVQKSFMALLNISSATFPAISQSAALGDIERIKQLYFRMSRLIAFIMFPILSLLFLSAYQIMDLWLGREFAIEGTPVLKIFAIAYLFISISAAPVAVSEGMNKPKIPALFATIGGLINLIAALILIPRFGITGAAWALLINCILQVPVFVWFVSSKVVKVSLRQLLTKAYFKPAASVIGASLLSAYFFKFEQSLVNLSIGVVVFIISYILLNISFNTFDKQDKMAVKFLLMKVTKVS